MCVWEFAILPVSRQIKVLDNGDILVNSQGSIYLLWDDNEDGKIDNRTETLLLTPNRSDLVHSVTYHKGYLYSSNSTNIMRWKFPVGVGTKHRKSITADPQFLLNNIHSTGHVTRTLVFDKDDILFMSVGSASNIDPDSSNARVVKCDLDFNNAPPNGYDWRECEVWADGTRNEVGLIFDSKGRLWGVENGADNVNRPDFGSEDYHNTNPCEEINLLDKKGFYGYPYCFSEGYLPAPIGKGNGTQWAMPRLIKSDEWCRNTSNVIPPVYCMEAHTAPLDIIFHESKTFPDPFKSGMFVAQHGSWNRQPSAGFQVVHLELDKKTGMPIQGSLKPFLQFAHSFGTTPSGRPVSLAKLSPCGPLKECLLVSSDLTDDLISYLSSRTGFSYGKQIVDNVVNNILSSPIPTSKKQVIDTVVDNILSQVPSTIVDRITNNDNNDDNNQQIEQLLFEPIQSVIEEDEVEEENNQDFQDDHYDDISEYELL
eukprot:gene5115-6366_t